MILVERITRYNLGLASRVARFFGKKITQFFYIYIKALFESTKHFETLKYLQ
jgi:hypothetical protein